MPPFAITASRPADLMVCHCALNSPCRPAAWKVKYGAGPSGYTWVQRQVTWPARPVASTIARSVADFTLSSWNDWNRSQVIAVIGHDRVAERIESRRDPVATKICRCLREVDDSYERRLCKIRIGDAFCVLLRLRRNTLTYPEFTHWSRIIEGQAIPLFVECMPYGFRNGTVGQRTNALHFAGLRGAEDRDREDEIDRKRYSRELTHSPRLSLSRNLPCRAARY